jgi:hypothetical protein
LVECEVPGLEPPGTEVLYGGGGRLGFRARSESGDQGIGGLFGRFRELEAAVDVSVGLVTFVRVGLAGGVCGDIRSCESSGVGEEAYVAVGVAGPADCW